MPELAVVWEWIVRIFLSIVGIDVIIIIGGILIFIFMIIKGKIHRRRK